MRKARVRRGDRVKVYFGSYGTVVEVRRDAFRLVGVNLDSGIKTRYFCSKEIVRVEIVDELARLA